jgi:hypothetical protein
MMVELLILSRPVLKSDGSSSFHRRSSVPVLVFRHAELSRHVEASESLSRFLSCWRTYTGTAAMTKMMMFAPCLYRVILLFPLILGWTHGFVVVNTERRCSSVLRELTSSKLPEARANDDESASSTAAASSVVLPEAAIRLREELLELGETTKRGFKASRSERKRAKEIISELSRFNPTNEDLEPLSPYYNYSESSSNLTTPTLRGKWTLIYTDAPDITSLDTSNTLLLPAVKLGRIGQVCAPPFIKNVIEWKRPEWMSSLPFSGTEDSRILQKVVTEGTASPNNPLEMNLKLVGIELMSKKGSTTMSWQDAIQQDGLPAALLQQNPVKLQGPLSAPFGKFTLLYLDDIMRIIKTGQGYYAVNVRADDYGQGGEWF